jgi:hypothetical protein
MDTGTQKSLFEIQEPNCASGSLRRSLVCEVQFDLQRAENAAGTESQDLDRHDTSSHGRGPRDGICEFEIPVVPSAPYEWLAPKARQHRTQLEDEDKSPIEEIAARITATFGGVYIRFLGDYSLIARTGQGRKWQVHVSKTGRLGLQFNGGRCERPKSIFELLARMHEPGQPTDDNDEYHVTVASLFKKLDDQGHRCAISGREITVENVELDHIQARADEGLHRLDNVHLVVRDINRAKGRMDLEKFIVLCNDVARTHPRPIPGNTTLDMLCI